LRSWWRERSAFNKWSKREVILPEGESLTSIFEYLASFNFDDGSSAEEMKNYLNHDFKRFLFTLNILPGGTETVAREERRKLLEIGANPYFTSMLIKKFTRYDLYMTNFFGLKDNKKMIQNKVNKDRVKIDFEFYHSNIETDELPFEESWFDVVCFCEVIEHLVNDPIQALMRVKKHLKKDGHLVLSTPNVARLENVSKMLAGANIYDPYSGYGAYGRHNREYNKHELSLLMDHMGFEIEEMFSADVHPDGRHSFPALTKVEELIKFRNQDLGQYIFVRARNTREANKKKPTWLYRSYPADELC
jgi:SAM-dependent methyltransferase